MWSQAWWKWSSFNSCSSGVAGLPNDIPIDYGLNDVSFDCACFSF